MASSSSEFFDNGVHEVIQCPNCGYVKDHPEHLGQTDPIGHEHFTCICLLFDVGSICCTKGYSSLLNYLPQLGVYAPAPVVFAKNYREAFDMGFILMTENDAERLHYCTHVQDNACMSYPYLRPTRFKIVVQAKKDDNS